MKMSDVIEQSKIMCADKNKIRTKRTYLLSPSTLTIFLIAEKPLSL